MIRSRGLVLHFQEIFIFMLRARPNINMANKYLLLLLRGPLIGCSLKEPDLIIGFELFNKSMEALHRWPLTFAINTKLLQILNNTSSIDLYYRYRSKTHLNRQLIFISRITPKNCFRDCPSATLPMSVFLSFARQFVPPPLEQKAQRTTTVRLVEFYGHWCRQRGDGKTLSSGKYGNTHFPRIDMYSGRQLLAPLFITTYHTQPPPDGKSFGEMSPGMYKEAL